MAQEIPWHLLSNQLSGELFTDSGMRRLFATDASVYREEPLAVCYPKDKADLKTILNFANEYYVPITPRAAGTSLAGQVVSKALIVDISKYFGQILEVNKEESSVWVEAGVIRDDLNLRLKADGLLFGPETSTSNRCMIAGMVGNNSCGSRSLVYGAARDHLLELKGFWADGSEMHLKEHSLEEFKAKLEQNDFEGEVYRGLEKLLSNPADRQNIIDQFPHPDIPRRNTGYALDALCEMQPFGGSQKFNLSKLIAGSEGTLCIISEIKLNLSPLPPKHVGLVCLQFDDLNKSLLANSLSLGLKPMACELIDHYILDCTKDHPTYSKYASFLEGSPKAVLVVEFAEESEEVLSKKHDDLIDLMKEHDLAYAWPMLREEEMNQVWMLRKAGLGLLSNIPGDAKPVAVIEDTAVLATDLPKYIQEFNLILEKHNLYCVHYAHAATGELHLRPILNLKEKKDRELFRTIAEEIAVLVKKYRGSVSGEHGDGRLRAEFLKQMIGEKAFQQCEELKKIFDPKGIINPGKIVFAPKMDENLRYEESQITPQVDTILNFDNLGGYVRAAEMCNGSADCKKTELSGGTMCPSFMVTKDEKHSTRARANVIREYIGRPEGNQDFNAREIAEVMDLCLSCKGCKSECPSNVDVAKLKAEAEYQKIKKQGASFQQKQFASFVKNYRRAAKIPSLFNAVIENPLLKSILGIHPNRSMPQVAKNTFLKRYKNTVDLNNADVVLFVDEFTNYLEPEIARDALTVLSYLDYKVFVGDFRESGRSYISKGFLDEAKSLAEYNVLKASIYEGKPIIGLEPSALLSFRDEYPDLLRGKLNEQAKEVAKRTYLIEEFLSKELDEGSLQPGCIDSKPMNIKVHGHCHQKALTDISSAKKVFSLLKNAKPRLIPSGCCGMAGSFGYSKDHYSVSQKVGELVLFPVVSKMLDDEILVASGTSCRHQIFDASQKEALHTISVIAALISD